MPQDAPDPAKEIARQAWRPSGGESSSRDLVVEVPVAVVFNGTTAAVMMTSPHNIADFALGFAITEGFIEGPEDIDSYEDIAHDQGIEARFWVKDARAEAIASRRRAMMGPVGCGLCGIDSLDAALRSVPRVTGDVTLDAQTVAGAGAALRARQPLQDRTRSTHAAGFLVPGDGLALVREDVGRHNALDKLIGALIAGGHTPGSGAIVMTSRLSVELVQKTAVFGAPILIGVSGPSSLAVETATAADMTLVGFCRDDGFDVFNGAERIRGL